MPTARRWPESAPIHQPIQERSASRSGRSGEATPGGTAVFGPKRTHLPFTAQEMTLLGEGAGFLADLLDLGRDQDRQADALSALSERKAGVDRRGEDLSRALGAAVQGQVRSGFRVFALGPLRVERDGVPLTNWGRGQGGLPTGGGDLRVPVRPRRARRGQGRDPRAHLARRRPRAGRPRLPPHAGRAAHRPRSQPTGARPRRCDRIPQRSVSAQRGARHGQRRRRPRCRAGVRQPRDRRDRAPDPPGTGTIPVPR